MRCGNYTGHNQQRGVVLILALVFLLLLSIVAVTSMRMGTLEVLMANNNQARMEAFELANGVGEAVIVQWEQNFVTDQILCGDAIGNGNPDVRCTDGGNSILMDDTAVTDFMTYLATLGNDTDVYYLTQYLGETTADQASVSAIAFNFELESEFDGSARRQGTSEIVMGVQIINPVAGGFGVTPEGDIDQYVHVPE
jgi:Tfp pilus assembly protein PilX